MKTRTKLVTAIVILGLVAGGGYSAYQYAKTKVGDKVISTLNDPTVKQAIEKEAKNAALLAEAKKAENQVLTDSSAKSALTGSNSNSKNASSSTSGTDAVATSGSAVTGGSSSANGSGLHFANRQAAINYAMSKFSAGEIARFMSAYANRSNLSSAQKAEIKQEILSRFSSSELQALLEASNK